MVTSASALSFPTHVTFYLVVHVLLALLLYVLPCSLLYRFLRSLSPSALSLLPLLPLSPPPLFLLHRRLSFDRYAALRTSPLRAVRRLYQSLAVLNVAYRIEMLHASLAPPAPAHEPLPGSGSLLRRILAEGPDTYQRKASNVVQVRSLLALVAGTVAEAGAGCVLDVGAGKALLTRAVWEALGRRVACVALDSRAGGARDEFYDPGGGEGGGKWERVVADVRHLASAVLPVVPSGPRTVAVTKHLCGGATDSSLRTLVAGELGERIGGVVLAPCCHQKCRFAEYCALRWLQESGFCTTHRGVRGGEECNDWKT